MSRYGKRLKFLVGEQKKFLCAIQETSGLNCEGLAKLSGVSPRSFRDWKREKLTLPLRVAEVFCEKYKAELPEDIEKLISRCEKHKEENSRKGGIIAYKKRGGLGTREGRIKGGRRALEVARSKGLIPVAKSFNLPVSFSEPLAEMVGILLGDGGITSSQVTVSLNAEADKKYVDFVVNLERQLFGIVPGVCYRTNSKAVNIYQNGVLLVKYLTEIGLKIGNKVKQQVGVPEWILSTRGYKTACLRGLMDTDGGVFHHRYIVNKKLYCYNKICFTNRSLPLLTFVFNTLNEFGFSAKFINKVENKKVWLYSQADVLHYFDVVGSHNYRLLKYYGGVA